MKKYMFMAVAGMLALSSCSNDDSDLTEQNAPRQMTFTAGYGDGAQTRATLDGDTKKVSFDAGDAISILSAKNTNKEFTTTAGGATASFTGTATDDATYYAVYPYNSSYELDGTTIKNVEIPFNQSGAASNGWHKTAPIAYATTTGSSLTFNNACALLKINNNSGSATIVIECSSGTLSGIFNLDTSTGTLTLTAQEEDGESTMVSAEYVPDKTIYLAIAPGEVEDFAASWVGVGDNNGAGQKIKEGSFTFEAGKIYDLGKTSDWPEL